MESVIGNITLNLSTLIYFVLYMPQVLYNLRRGSTEGLSLLMHVILMIGYIADMMYGFGRHMEWQYRLVSMVGLFCLSLQHIQIGYYQKLSANYIAATVIVLCWFIFAIFAIMAPNLPPRVYIDAGSVAWITGVVYTLPQFWKNYRFASSMGVSLLFIYLDILCSSCDVVSSWCLNWDYPSKFGSPLECILGLFLLAQVYFYRQAKPKIA